MMQMNKRITSSRARACSKFARNMTHIIKMYNTGIYTRLNPNIYPDDAGVAEYYESYGNLALMMLTALQLSSSDK
jgi:hypothetical protein